VEQEQLQAAAVQVKRVQQEPPEVLAAKVVMVIYGQ